jgi:tRNA pseudouridine38-40 synthase
VHGAGRTDAGVHALGQVASATIACGHDTGALARGLNAILPGDIRVLDVREAPPEFHARFSARSKTYRYVLRIAAIVSPFERAYVWHVPEPLDLDAMRTAAAALIGTHDYSAFRSTGSDVASPVRTITRSEITSREPERARPTASTREDVLIAYEVQGDGFLRHMVRAIVGTLVEIGRGRRPAASIGALLDGGQRAEAGATAPPQGLFLVGVDYD